MLGPGTSGIVQVLDEGGKLIASVTLRQEQRVRVDVPAGTYRLQDATGASLATVRVDAGQSTTSMLPPLVGSQAMTVAPPATTARRNVDVAPPRPPLPAAPVSQSRRRNWKRWGAPLLSALVPGVGQMVNRQPGKGVGILLGTAGGLAAVGALYFTRDRMEGAGLGQNAVSQGEEAARWIALAGITGVLHLLYAGQIMDAHAVAVNKRPKPRTKHTIFLEFGRMATVGARANQPEMALYRDWSVTVMGQVAKRFTIGISDASIKSSLRQQRTTVQAGIRLSYRFFDRTRIWLGVGLGSIFQGTSAARQPDSLDSQDARPSNEGRFSAIPYAQFETRLFILDRWSLNVTPRMSIPLGNRYYADNLAIPKYALTFELGTSVGVYF